MSWILQNKFVAVLIACTVILAGLLLYVGSKASGRYQEGVEEFQQASAQVANYERLALYPSQENLDGKTKALSDYEQAIDELAGKFEKFQSAPPVRISPQDFSNRLVAANDRINSRLTDSNVAVPADFYSGFEEYTGALAQSGATAVLSKHLDMIEAVMGNLANAKPTEIHNFLRERQPEESGNAHELKKDAVTRPHSFELTFQGTEASARDFVTSLVNTDQRFIVIRTLRITNETTTPPKSSSAQFAASAPAADPAANPFGGGFAGIFGDILEGDPQVNDGDEGDEEVEGAPAQPAPQPAPPATGTRMLGQVAGNELIRVFIRFDVMEFLPQASTQPSDES